MADAYSEDAVELLARLVFMAPMVGGMDWDLIDEDDRNRYRKVACAQLDALAAAGLLATDAEYAVQTAGGYIIRCDSRDRAEHVLAGRTAIREHANPGIIVTRRVSSWIPAPAKRLGLDR
jgi:hypothetical protein